jgi:hypothetical protein
MRAASSSAKREIELLQQQLSLKDAVIADLRESKIALIDAAIAHLIEHRERLLSDKPAADTQALVAQHVPAPAATAEAELQRLAAVCNWFISRSELVFMQLSYNPWLRMRCWTRSSLLWAEKSGCMWGLCADDGVADT